MSGVIFKRADRFLKIFKYWAGNDEKIVTVSRMLMFSFGIADDSLPSTGERNAGNNGHMTMKRGTVSGTGALF